MPISVPAALFGAAIVLLSPAISSGQSITLASGQDPSQVWPAPVRNVTHTVVQSWPVEPGLVAAPLNPLRPSPPLHPHHVIKSPTAQPKTTQHATKHAPVPLHPHLMRHRAFQPKPALLPEANLRETWKTPYSYGYFGASGSRHWRVHHGYRDRSTEWRLR